MKNITAAISSQQNAEVRPVFLTRAESAVYLKNHGYPVAKGQLQKLASIGGGPVYRTFGNRALYCPDELLAWAESKLSAPRSNTSEAGCV